MLWFELLARYKPAKIRFYKKANRIKKENWLPSIVFFVFSPVKYASVSLFQLRI